MLDRLTVVAFDVDPGSLRTLSEALPEWEITVVSGASAISVDRDWNPGAAALLIVGARAEMAETLGLCRGLRSQAGRASVPILVLVPPEKQALVRAVLDAGADSCLVLPVHAKDIASMVTHACQGNQPGRHTLNLDHAQREDQNRDNGGEG